MLFLMLALPLIVRSAPSPEAGSAAQELERLLVEQARSTETSTSATTTTIAAVAENATNILTNLVKIIGEVKDVADVAATKKKTLVGVPKNGMPVGAGPVSEMQQQFPGAELQFHETFSFLQPDNEYAASPVSQQPAPPVQAGGSSPGHYFPVGAGNFGGGGGGGGGEGNNELTLTPVAPAASDPNKKQFRVFSVRFPDGNYTGELDHRGFRHGWGEMYFRNGSVYGPGGIFLYGEGDRYVGQWKNHSQHGK